MSEIETKRTGNRLRIAGEMTIYQAAALKADLVGFLDAGATLELDLSDVSEFDSAGFQLLALVRREAEQHGKTLRLCAVSLPVRKLLSAYRVENWITAKPGKKASRRAGAGEVQ